MKKPSLPLVAFATCGLIWGSTFLVIRVGNDSLPALWACSLRFAVAGAVLNLILLATGQKWPKGAALKAAAWFGFWEFGLSMPLVYRGERVVPSGLAAVLFAICPIMAMFEAKLLKMEELSFPKLAAALLSLGGVGIIFWREVLAGGSPAGLLAVCLAAAFAPIATLMLQRAPRQSAIGANAVGALVGLPCALLASLALREHWSLPTTQREVLPVVYLALAGSVGAFVTFAWLAGRWKATTVSFLGVIVPVLAVILGAVFRHEAVERGSLLGGVIVVLGVTIALRSERDSKVSLPI